MCVLCALRMHVHDQIRCVRCVHDLFVRLKKDHKSRLQPNSTRHAVLISNGAFPLDQTLQHISVFPISTFVVCGLQHVLPFRTNKQHCSHVEREIVRHIHSFKTSLPYHTETFPKYQILMMMMVMMMVLSNTPTSFDSPNYSPPQLPIRYHITCYFLEVLQLCSR